MKFSAKQRILNDWWKLIRFIAFTASLVRCGTTHPWIIIRITNLIQWVEEGSYERILRKRRLVAVNSSGAICECGEVIQEDLYYCLFCGRRVARRHETEVN